MSRGSIFMMQCKQFPHTVHIYQARPDVASRYKLPVWRKFPATFSSCFRCRTALTWIICVCGKHFTAQNCDPCVCTYPRWVRVWCHTERASCRAPRRFSHSETSADRQIQTCATLRSSRETNRLHFKTKLYQSTFKTVVHVVKRLLLWAPLKWVSPQKHSSENWPGGFLRKFTLPQTNESGAWTKLTVKWAECHSPLE